MRRDVDILNHKWIAICGGSCHQHLPCNSANLEKPLGWVGGDGTQLWLFDLLSEPTQLTIIEPEAAANTLIFGLPLAGLLDGWQLQPLSAVGPRSPERVQSRLGPATLFATQAGSPPSRLATVDGQLEVLYSDWNVIDRAKDDTDGRSAGQWFPERVEWRLQAPEATATFGSASLGAPWSSSVGIVCLI